MSEMNLQTAKTVVSSVCETIEIFEKLTGLDFESRNETHLRIAGQIEQVKFLTNKSRIDKNARRESIIIAESAFSEIDALKIKMKINVCYECLNYASCRINNVLTNDPSCCNFKPKTTIKKPNFNKKINP